METAVMEKEPTELQRKIGDRMRRAAQESGLTQKEIAERMGKSQAAVSRWFDGINVVDPDLMEEFAAVVNKPAAWLWTGDLPLEEEQVLDATVKCLVRTLRGQSMREAFADLAGGQDGRGGPPLSPDRARVLDILEPYVLQRICNIIPDWQELSDEELGQRVRPLLQAGL
jgi:transcriptional regulator with XRE-family HTH domain